MEALIGKTLKTKEMEEFDMDKLKDVKVLCLYFAASYCHPSRKFSELLREFYEEINRDSYRMEIVLVPFDHEEEEFKKFMARMPWTTIPFNDQKGKELIQKFGITSVPRLYVFDKNGVKITEDGRKEICVDGENAFENWLAKCSP